jgi:membrane dipeptidase
MRKTLLIAGAMMLAACGDTREPADADAAALAHADSLLAVSPIVDGHNDLPWRIREDTIAPMDADKYDITTSAPGHTDIPRLRKGRVGAQFWSIYIPGDSARYGFAKMQHEQIKIARRVVEKYPADLMWALTSDEIRTSFQHKMVGSLLGLEGGHAIEHSLDSLRSYYALGARYMTLTHNVTLAWADAALDSALHGGLTKFGEEVVREMNRLGMLVDLSHVSPATMSDALNVTEAPVIFSHSSARAITEHPRNVPDSILARLKQNGGVVMVTFVPAFVSQAVADHATRRTAMIDSISKRSDLDAAERAAAESAWVAANPAPRATMADVVHHIEHVKLVAGADHVGIGSDFDGISEVVVGLEDVSTFPALFAELVKRGWSDADLKKLAGENVLRALGQAEQVAARLQKERQPSKATIQQLDGKRPPAGKAR